MPDRVDRLIERVLCPRAGAFGPEVGLDPVAGEARFTAQAQDRKQTQWPLLLRGYGDGASLVAQGKRSQKLEGQHFAATRALLVLSDVLLRGTSYHGGLCPPGQPRCVPGCESPWRLK